MSNPNRGPLHIDPARLVVPPGWEKGEPLTMAKVSETCYQLYRSGSYLQLPGAPISKEVQCLEFSSRVEMVDFQQWWDNPEDTPWKQSGPHFWLTPGEFVEIVQELFQLDLQEILGNRQGVDKVPAFSMSLHVKDQHMANLLNMAHGRFVAQVQRILQGGAPLESEDDG